MSLVERFALPSPEQKEAARPALGLIEEHGLEAMRVVFRISTASRAARP